MTRTAAPTPPVRARPIDRLRADRAPARWLYATSAVAAVILVPLTSRRAPHSAGHDEGSLLHDWVIWSLMVAAMMLPLIAPVVCRVCAGGLWARRGATWAEFLSGYLAPWLIGGLAGSVVARSVAPQPVTPETLAAVALLLAACWHVTPLRRRLMSRCGAVQPGALRGRRATIDAVANGWATGLRCIATCGPAMIAMLLSHRLLLMAGITVVLWAERLRGPNPAERVAHPAQAIALLAVAASVAAGL